MSEKQESIPPGYRHPYRSWQCGDEGSRKGPRITEGREKRKWEDVRGQKKGKPGRLPQKDSGSVLLSHNLAVAVSSALEGLTAVFGMGTGGSPPAWPPERRKLRRRAEREESAKLFRTRTKSCVKPLDRLVLVHSNPCRPYMPSLSTWSSTRGLLAACAAGYLILRWVSRLDAFSSSPVPT